MAGFIYEKPFQTGDDTTQYRLLTKEFVVLETLSNSNLLMEDPQAGYNGKKPKGSNRTIVNVDPRGLELLAREAFSDLAFFQRESHLLKLSAILSDTEASENDKYVAYTMLRNSVVAAEGQLPWCQDTGTALVIADKGENIYTGVEDARYLSKGIFDTYSDKNLRYSQVVPFSMFDEKNSGTNLPAQIDIQAVEGDEYKFLFIAKGGGSANKTFLYQQTKSLLNRESLTNFIREKINDLGTSACPPYHLALVIGGSSADQTLKIAKEASACYLDHLPVEGDASGRAFRDLEWEGIVEQICRESGIGAQYGGKYFVHDVRVIRMARHAASCPVALCVSCSADRNVKAKINRDGIFLEVLEKNPARFLPVKAPEMARPVEVDLDRPLDEVLKQLSKYPVRTLLSLTGTLVVARDIAHARIKELLDGGAEMPEYFKKHPVYYAGPAKTPEGMPSGSLGPTTAGRMDGYLYQFQERGGALITIAKGNRGKCVVDSCKKHGGFYLGAIGGPAALMARENILSSEVIDFEELGMEAVRKIRVKDMPAFILIDDKGNDR